jgi:hypothetical protein
MAVVSQWRAAGGLGALTQSSQLEANAAKTCADSGGNLNHELNPGTMAQVLAPGDCTNQEFTSCYVGGWLCEIPSLQGLNGICATAGQGWNHGGETGHADILYVSTLLSMLCSGLTLFTGPLAHTPRSDVLAAQVSGHAIWRKRRNQSRQQCCPVTQEGHVTCTGLMKVACWNESGAKPVSHLASGMLSAPSDIYEYSIL